MRVIYNRHNVPCFEANGPRRALVPVICYSCLHFDPGHDSSWIGPAEYPECNVLLFFPTSKGTCKRRKLSINTVMSTYRNNGITTTELHVLPYQRPEISNV